VSWVKLLNGYGTQEGWLNTATGEKADRPPPHGYCPRPEHFPYPRLTGVPTCDWCGAPPDDPIHQALAPDA
jgi:hypothetical protein